MSRRSSRNRSRGRGRKRPLFLVAVGLTIAALVAIGFVAALQWPSGSDVATAPKGPAVVSLGLKGPLSLLYAGDMVAAAAGLFAQAGLQVDVRADTLDPIAAVAGGNLTFGVADSIGFLKARAGGAPVVAFAAGYLESSDVFYALESSHIAGPADFIGHRIARRAGTNAAIIYDALMKETGLSRGNTRETGDATDLASLIDGKVDVIPGRVGREAFILRDKSLPYAVISASNYGLHVPDTVYFASEKTMRDRPELVRRFLKAVIAGWTITLAAPDKAVPLIVQASDGRLTPAQVRFGLAAQRDFVKPLGRRVAEYDDRQWKQLRDVLIGARVLDSTIDLSRAINYDFLKEAYRKPITFGN